MNNSSIYSMNERRRISLASPRSPDSDYEKQDKMLIMAILKSYFDDIESYIIRAILYSEQNCDYYLDQANNLILQMLRLEFFKKRINYMDLRLKEIIDMAYTKKEKKTDSKNNEIKIEYKGSNKNVFNLRIWKPKKFEKKGYTRFFSLLEINGVTIVCGLMLPEGSEGEYDAIKDISKDTFFAFPSYYNEDQKKYSNQVYIKDTGLNEDIKELIEYAIAEGKLLDI